MYAIAQSGGKQFKIEQNSRIKVPTLKSAVGDKVRLESILLLSRESGVSVGAPFVEGAYAEARVVRHGRGRKINIIKYKRRKNFRRTIGHRQGFTELVIDLIVESSEAPKKKSGKKAEAAPAAQETQAPVMETAPETAVVEAPEAQAAPAETEAKPKRTRKKAAEKAEDESAEKAE